MSKLRCIHCFIDVERIPEAKKIIGKGEPILFKHKSLRDEGGNPYCGKPLRDADVEHYSDTDS